MKATEKVVVSATPTTVEISANDLPKHESDALCRVLIRSVSEAFKNPAVATDYEQWLINRYGKREGKKRFAKIRT